jgi:branched-chain amino acid transport system ATP-binding protein
MSLIRKMKEDGITVMLIEHRMQMVMGISEHIIVLNFGEKIAEGTPEEIRGDSSVIAAYLGKQYVI